ncbi:uncharacterized protein LOC142335277 [Convolutriloba macropyga]|uniref:uncharacterized protein LOC142335277 n=1 Tax=Convolutriloba macropyga TaxID=536237 RepID=UPI003F527770
MDENETEGISERAVGEYEGVFWMKGGSEPCEVDENQDGFATGNGTLVTSMSDDDEAGGRETDTCQLDPAIGRPQETAFTHFINRFRNMDQEEKMAACFFFVISSFLLLSIPDLVLHSLDVVIGGDPEWYGMFQWLQRFTQPLFCVIFAINPFIYYFMCSYFRTYVRAVLARLRLIPTNSIT